MNNQSESQQESEVLDVKRAAELLRLSSATVHRLIRAGTLPAAKIGPRVYRLRRGAVDHLLDPRQAKEG
jgi:excisionase family DNA binding protein